MVVCVVREVVVEVMVIVLVIVTVVLVNDVLVTDVVVPERIARSNRTMEVNRVEKPPEVPKNWQKPPCPQ